MTAISKQIPIRSSIKDGIQAVLTKALIGMALILPYGIRVRFFGWLASAVAAPVAGWKRRVRKNLSLVMPELPKTEVKLIAERVCNNVGRTLIEIYSGKDFLQHVADTPFQGPGLDAFEQLRAAERPMVLITAHLGNYDVIRGTLSRRGLDIGALYRPMSNKAFNQNYVDAISAIAEPVFPVGRVGVSNLVRHLRGGGSMGIVADVSNYNGPLLNFFGQPAHTPLSAAEWAVKYDAPLIPIFALREPDGLHFRVHVAEPIPHGRPDDMMQAFNDIVENLVRENMDQWFWIHRRWKLSPEAQASLEKEKQAG